MTMPGEENENEDREIPVDDEETTVDLDATSDEGGDEGGEEEPKGRKARRAERGRLMDELRQRDTTIAEMRDRLSRTEGTLSELRQSMQDTRTRTERADATDDPAEAELQDVYERQEALAERIAAKGEKITEAELERFKAENRKLDRQKLEIIAKRNAPAPQRQDPNAAVRQGLEMAYSDVYGNDRARSWARGEYERLVNHPNEALRKPHGLETVKLALENTRKEFGMSRSAPTETEKARTSGVSRGGTGGGGERDNVVRMSAFHQGLADKAFKHIKDPKERAKKWANGPGRKMLERQRAAKRA